MTKQQTSVTANIHDRLGLMIDFNLGTRIGNNPTAFLNPGQPSIATSQRGTSETGDVGN